MRLGFNWELGPFELWDAAGVQVTVERMKKEGSAGRSEMSSSCWLRGRRRGICRPIRRRRRGGSILISARSVIRRSEVPSGFWSVEVAKKSNGVVKKSSGGVVGGPWGWCGLHRGFHSKMNTIGSDIVQLISQSLKVGGAGDGFEELL